jgi:hypothetical protein
VNTKLPRDPDRDPAPAPGPTDPPDDDDVEGHGLLDIQLGQQMAVTRSREAADWARGEKARREAQQDRKTKKGRLFGR